tara:strand:+ start:74 stop:1837 length:1764 start_codon:yes stop_codon:yes gene_type:complete
MKIFQKLWHLLPLKQRSAAIVMLGWMFLALFLEMLGVGLIVPALVIMIENDLGDKYPALLPLLNALGNPSHEWLVVAGILTLVGVFVLKNLFLAFFAWRQADFVLKIQTNISKRLFEGYMSQPYTFHLQRNSAQLIRNTIGHAASISGVMSQGLLLVMESLVIFGVSAMLLVVEPLATILVLTALGLAGWGLNRLTQKHILRWGEAFELHEGLRIQHLQQGLGGIKDVRVLGRESEFFTQYEIHNLGSAKITKRRTTMQALPRLWLELLAVSGLAALVVIMVSQGRPMEMLLPVAGLFSVAAFRLMPSVNRVLSSFQGVDFSLPVINTLHDEFQLLDEITVPQSNHLLPFNSTLSMEQVSFQYPSAEAFALSQINISIPKNVSIGFLGPSGAGKSTLIDIILGLLTPTSGVVKVDGVDIQASLRGWQDQVGYVPQFIYLTDDTLRRNIAFGLPAEQISEEAVCQAICAAQLEQFIKELPEGLDTIVGERGIRLSGGQRQRLGIARALYHDPAVLVLDEATSSLDMDTEQYIMQEIKALSGKKTIIIVAHRLSTIKHCQYLYCLDKGRIAEDGDTSMILGKITEQKSL